MGFWKNIKQTMTNLSFKGRSSRKELIHYVIFSFLWGIISGLFCFFPIFFSVGLSVAQTGKIDFTNISTGFIIYAIISIFIVLTVGIWLFIANITLYVRRFHDLNYSGWAYFIYCIIVFVITLGPQKYQSLCSTISSLLGFALMVFLMSAKGTYGPNKYGESKLPEEITTQPTQEA